mgnify:CR=1 FL=1
MIYKIISHKIHFLLIHTLMQTNPSFTIHSSSSINPEYYLYSLHYYYYYMEFKNKKTFQNVWHVKIIIIIIIILWMFESIWEKKYVITCYYHHHCKLILILMIIIINPIGNRILIDRSKNSNNRCIQYGQCQWT